MRFKYFLILSAISLFCFCCVGFDHRMWTTIDPWYKPYSRNVTFSFAKETERNIWDIDTNMQINAQALLDNEVIVELSKDEVKDYLNTGIKMRNEMKYFLVRAVYLNKGTGSFSCYYQNTNLLVYHGSLGKRAVPMKREALIIELEKNQLMSLLCVQWQSESIISKLRITAC